jgi:hypothetical protein
MGRPDANQHVNVIGGAVDDQGGSAHFADDASEIGKQIWAELRLDQRTPALCAENHMQQNVGRCMRQSLSPRWGSPFVVADPRLAPWAAFWRRFAASLYCSTAGPAQRQPSHFPKRNCRPNRQRGREEWLAETWRLAILWENAGRANLQQSSWQFQLQGPVAQRLEQHTHNVLVLGSNPSRPTSTVCYSRKTRNL